MSRPSKWGNPFAITISGNSTAGKKLLRYEATTRFRLALLGGAAALPFCVEDTQRELKNKNLACWCPLDGACHADVLLEIANRRRPRE